MPQPFLAHAAVRIEYQLPQMPLPSLGLAHRVNVGSPGGAPSSDHAPPRNRVFAKQPRQLRGEQERSELDVGVSFGSPEDVVARRFQAGVVAMVRASKALEEDQLELIGVQDLEVLVRRLEKLGQVAAQERELQICRDADRFSQPIANELLDDAVGHDDRHPLQRIASLMRGYGLGQRRDQIFESI